MAKMLMPLALFRDTFKNPVKSANGDESIIAKVSYTYGGKTEEEVLPVILKLNGDVVIEGGEILTKPKVHLAFQSNFVKYIFDAEHSCFVIKGNSRLIGLYEVRITEV